MEWTSAKSRNISTLWTSAASASAAAAANRTVRVPLVVVCKHMIFAASANLHSGLADPLLVDRLNQS